MTRPDQGESDSDYMERALAFARHAAAEGEVPVGAVLVGEDGGVLAGSGNAPIARHDPSAHAEMLVLRAAGAALSNYRLPNTTLYVTLEPCPMCAGALVHARIARLVYALADPRSGACGSVFDLTQSSVLNHRIEVTGGLLADQSSLLLTEFFSARR
jgi:tRNA(adenine34) deaminase